MNGGIDLVLPSFGSGGAERVMVNLAVALHARGHLIRVVVIDGRGPLRDELPSVVEIVDLQRSRARLAAPALMRVIRQAQPDAVFSSHTHVNILLGLIRPLLPRGTRLIVREPLLPRTGAVPRLEALLLGQGIRRADSVIASSERMRAQLADLTGDRCNIHLVPNPVDVDGLRSAVDPAEALPASDPPSSRPIQLVAVGRLVSQKGHADLLDALARPVTGDATLEVIGDGPLRGELETTVRRHGLERRVRFHGRIDDRRRLATLVAGADALVQAAHFEGMPNAVLEALALGTPVLATTDLTMLAELSEELGSDALRLVPRDALATAIGATARREGPFPRPTLLPARFALAAVVDRLLDILVPEGA
jgi:glycosyltransferase involved in cell wall biosynthesis